MSEPTPTAAPAAPEAPAAPASATPNISVDDGMGPSDAVILAKLQAARDATGAPTLPQEATQPPAATTPAATPAADATGQLSLPAVDVAPPASPDPIDERIRAYVARQAEDQAAKTKVNAEREAERAELARLKKLEQRLREDPLSVNREAGWDFESLARVAVGEATPGGVEINRLRADIAAIKAEAAATVAATRAESERLQTEANLAKWQASVMPTLQAKPEAFKHALAIMDPTELVTAVQDVVTRVYTGSGGTRILGIEEAASLLEQQAKARVERIRPLVNVAPVQQPPAARQSPAPPVAGLTNRQTQASPTPPDPDDLSDEALTKRALAYGQALMKTKR